MKRNNLFLVAFVSVLIHALVFGFTLPGIGAMAVILSLVGFQDYLEAKRQKEEAAPLYAAVEALKADLIKTKKDLKDILDDKLEEMHIRVAKSENISKMANFNLKK